MTPLQILGAILLGFVGAAGAVAISWHLWGEGREDVQPLEHHHCRIVCVARKMSRVKIGISLVAVLVVRFFILISLAGEPTSAYVRQSAAANHNLPVKILIQLAGNKSSAVRQAVALNANTPEAILIHLAADKNPDVRRGVSQNPSAPAKVLARLAKDKEPWVRLGVAKQFYTPEGVLAMLAGDEHDLVRTAAWENPSLPAHMRAMVILAE